MNAMASQITSLTIVYSTVHPRHRSKKTTKLRVTGLCVRSSPVTDEFPTQTASNAENVSIWWRHHANQNFKEEIKHLLWICLLHSPINFVLEILQVQSVDHCLRSVHCSNQNGQHMQIHKQSSFCPVISSFWKYIPCIPNALELMQHVSNHSTIWLISATCHVRFIP